MTETIELTPIPEDVEQTIEFTLAQNDKAHDLVSAAIKSGLRNIFFVGCGGSYTGHIPAAYLLESKAQIPTYILNSDEFNTKKPVQLGKNSLVITGSHSGNTKETIRAAEIAKMLEQLWLQFLER